MSFFLFAGAGSSTLPGSWAALSPDGNAPDLAGVAGLVPAPAPERRPEPFSRALAQWHELRGRVEAVERAAPTARDAIEQSGAETAFHELFRLWNRLAEAAAQWSGIRAALIGLGEDIVRYATGIVPDRYRALAAFFAEAEDRPLSPDSATRCRALLEAIVAEAEGRVTNARELSSRIAPLHEALSEFADAFGREVRSPDIRIELPDTPPLCLSYGDDGYAMAGDPANGPARQLWRVEPDEASGAFTIRTPDGARAMVTDTKEAIFEAMRRPGWGPWAWGPRPTPLPRPQPYLAPADVAGTSSAALFDLNRTGTGYIVPREWPGRTFDCAGNSGWEQGTAILNWEQNGGNNQHWRCVPPPRLASELRFYDIAAPIVRSLDLSGLGMLEGDWRAIAEELKDGVADTLRSIDANEPLVGSLSVEETIRTWADLAARAEEAMADL